MVTSNEERDSASEHPVRRMEEAQRALAERLHEAEERIEELESEAVQRERRALRARDRAVVETRRLIEHQLAYRLGQKVIRALRNPLWLPVLPASLLREYWAFRKTERPELAAPESGEPERPKRQQITLEVADAMSIGALAELPSKKLRNLSRDASRAGMAHLQLSLAEARWKCIGDAQAAKNLRLKRGQLCELRTDWLPPVASRPLEPTGEMRILHVFKTLYPQESTGGAVRNWSIMTHQAAAGFEPVAAVTAAALPEALAARNEGRDGPFRIESDGAAAWFCQLAALDRSEVPRDALLGFDAQLLARACDAERPSLIHAASGFRGYDNALTGLAVARARGLPLVYEVRSFHEHTWGPMKDGIAEAELTKLRAVQENRCMAEADAVVTISEAMAAELGARGVPEQRLFVVPNSVDAAFLEPVDPGKVAAFRDRRGCTDKTVIGYVSNMSRREGHRVLIEAFAQLTVERSDLALLLVGDGDRREVLEAQVRELGLGDAVIFTGAVDHADIMTAYGGIDLFVVPRLPDYASDYVTPMKPFEAMALGVPLIMSDRPVAREVIGEEERGLFFRTGKAEHLAETMRRMLDAPDEARTRAAAAREWVRSERSWPSTIARYRDIYAAAHEAHRAGGGR